MGHNSVILGHLKSTGIPQVDELSMGPPDLGCHTSCNHIQANKCEMIGNITSPYIYKNYDGQTLECNLKVEIPIRLQRITFLVDCYKNNRMQRKGHYDIILGNSFID